MNAEGMLSIFHVRVSELYPKRALMSEEPWLAVPFCPVQGEAVEYLGQTSDGILALSNYRVFLQLKATYYNIPLGLLEAVECRDIFYLHLHCKDARSIRCAFTTNEHCMEWHRRLQKAIAPAKSLDDIFAFAFYAWSIDETGEELAKLGLDASCPLLESWDSKFLSELNRMEFDLQGAWRICSVNRGFHLCSSYPQSIVVPACVSDDKLQKVATFRSAQRVPAAVWRHRGNGAVISRCSQPEVGWLGWRSSEDEELLKAIADACATDRGRNNQSDFGAGPLSVQDGNTPSLEEFTEEIQRQGDSKKVLILDARSYATAVANRARGGGCECPEYYSSCEIQFMNLANIHSIRKSFQNVRLLCSSSTDQANWYSQLESTKWIHHMAGLIKTAVTVATAVEKEERPVLVHCSDGWDRTPQIVALAEILLDPFYRTFDGFQVLVEKEWLDFGHKFGDRCGQGLGAEDLNERCPVFLQWLDCVHQLLNQFQCSFEFNQAYLVKLAHHTYSNLFGTFLFNSGQERINMRIQEKTHSIWKFLKASCNQDKFRNNLFIYKDQVLWPSYNVGDLILWTKMYIGDVPLEAAHLDVSSSVTSLSQDVDEEVKPTMTKTRSCDNLLAATDHSEELQRRSSDPNILDSILETHMAFSQPIPQQPTSRSEYRKGAEEEEQAKDIGRLGEAESNSLGQALLRASLEEDEETEEARKENCVDRSSGKQFSGGGTETHFSNGAVDPSKIANYESENEDTETLSESKSGAPAGKVDVQSIESSTDTLVAEAGIIVPYDNNNVEVGGVVATTDTSLAVGAVSADGARELAAVHGCPHAPKVKDYPPPPTSSSPLPSSYSDLPASSSSPSPSPSPWQPSLEGTTSANINSTFPTSTASIVTNPGSKVANCQVCASSRRLLMETSDLLSREREGSPSSGPPALPPLPASAYSPSSSSRASAYSTPLHSRTPSSGFPATPSGEDRTAGISGERGVGLAQGGGAWKFDVDGLTLMRDDVQARIHQIVADYKMQIDALQRELHVTRIQLSNQIAHHCGQSGDQPDDNGSLPDSVCSGEQQSVGQESLHSDVSWEAVEERDTRPPLWVPDYAATHCMGCHHQFWLGRRRHHCRNCGKVFCADCSEHFLPIPSEQLFQPVRVCTSCYQVLGGINCGSLNSCNGIASLVQQQQSFLGCGRECAGGGGGGGGRSSLGGSCKHHCAEKISKPVVTAAST